MLDGSRVKGMSAPSCAHYRTFAVLASVCGLVGGCGPNAAPVDSRIPVRVTVAGLSSGAGPVDDAAPFYAAIIASPTESPVAFRIAGRLVGRSVDVGSTVAAGTALGRIDPAPFELALDGARGSAAAGRAGLRQAENELARNMPLAAERIVPPAQIDRLTSERDTARARLVEAESRMRAARNDVSYTILRSPISGVVTEVSAEPGQYFAAGQIAFRVAQTTALEALADVPESVVGSLRPGMPVIVELTAAGDTKVSARIREVAAAADPATRTYRVKATLQGVGGARIGMTARVRFPSAGDVAGKGGRNSVRLPAGALFNKGDRPAVWIVRRDGQSLELRPVTVGSYAGDSFVVKQGIAPGERVVTAGVHRLDARQRVRIWDGQLP